MATHIPWYSRTSNAGPVQPTPKRKDTEARNRYVFFGDFYFLPIVWNPTLTSNASVVFFFKMIRSKRQVEIKIIKRYVTDVGRIAGAASRWLNGFGVQCTRTSVGDPSYGQYVPSIQQMNMFLQVSAA